MNKKKIEFISRGQMKRIIFQQGHKEDARAIRNMHLQLEAELFDQWDGCS